jgi:hypothetical protein
MEHGDGRVLVLRGEDGLLVGQGQVARQGGYPSQACVGAQQHQGHRCTTKEQSSSTRRGVPAYERTGGYKYPPGGRAIPEALS